MTLPLRQPIGYKCFGLLAVENLMKNKARGQVFFLIYKESWGYFAAALD